MGGTNKRYDPEFRKKVVRLVLEEGRTISSINKEFNLGEGTVRSWIRQFNEECEVNPDTQNRKDIYEENRKLRKELEESKSSRILRKGNRLEKYHFTDEYAQELLLRRLKVYPNAYYNYKKHRKAFFLKQKAEPQKVILDIYHEYSGLAGHRMMAVFLARKNIALSKTTVLKYMQELNVRSVVTPKKPRYRKGECYKKFDNLLNRDFTADAPNRKWCTDFTCIFLSDGSKRYNCSILDLYDKSVIATKNSVRIDALLAIDTPAAALERTHAVRVLLLHSDQGSQYTSRAFPEFCEQKHIRQSMSKAGRPYDNSPMESFYGTFKAEFINQH